MGAELESGRGDVERERRGRFVLGRGRATPRHLAGGLAEARDELVEFEETGGAGRRALFFIDEYHHAVGAVGADAKLKVGERTVHGEPPIKA